MAEPINAVQILRRISDLIDARELVSAESIGAAVIGLRDSIRFAIEQQSIPQPAVYPQPGYDQGAGLRPEGAVKDSLTAALADREDIETFRKHGLMRTPGATGGES